MSDEVFQRYSACYDLLYGDKDYAAEAAYVTRTLRAVAPEARTLLEFGSGTGKHGRLLARDGYQVHGVERSEWMVKSARCAQAAPAAAGAGSFDCATGDIRSLELNRSYDGVVALFHVVSYQTSNDDVQRTFSSAARHIKPGGGFFFDVWHGPAVLHERPSVRVKRVEDATRRLVRIAEPELDTNASVVTVHYTMLAESKTDGEHVTFQEEHRMRFFFPQEVALLAEHAGLQVERAEEFMTGRAPSETTWGVAYILRKSN
jgi:SAM-dependent methyltransferase